MNILELKVPPLALVAITAALMWGLAEALPGASFNNAWRLQLALVCAIVGFAVAVFGVIAFRRAGTTVDPRVPEQSVQLVSSGIYRRTRNPMYLGFLLALLGWALYLSNGISFILLPVFTAYITRFQIIPEERAMRQKFGDEYSAYRGRVRRWL